jgi:hypothetical protein
MGSMMDEMRIRYFRERNRLHEEADAALKRGDYDGADRAQKKNLLVWREEDKRLKQG